MVNVVTVTSSIFFIILVSDITLRGFGLFLFSDFSLEFLVFLLVLLYRFLANTHEFIWFWCFDEWKFLLLLFFLGYNFTLLVVCSTGKESNLSPCR